MRFAFNGIYIDETFKFTFSPVRQTIIRTTIDFHITQMQLRFV